jgi:putative phosphoribosyl transferase
MPYLNRTDAGQKLIPYLAAYKNQANTCVMGLPRGGVVLAYEVACALALPLDLIIVRKVGAPNNPELAIGAVTETGQGYRNEEIIALLQVSEAYITKASHEEQQLAAARREAYRKYCPNIDPKGQTIILVDDGLATGATMKAAIASIKAAGAARIVMAVPVASADTLNEIKDTVDEAIAIETPVAFCAVGQVYRDFGQTSDAEVIDLLQKALARKLGD